MKFAYTIELDLRSSPEELWPLVSDTDRFNRDAHVPAVERLGNGANARRRLRLTRLGLPVEWEEEPFEWVSPHRFSVTRRYSKGPVESMRIHRHARPARPGHTSPLRDRGAPEEPARVAGDPDPGWPDQPAPVRRRLPPL